jgi:hypothetical protein
MSPTKISALKIREFSPYSLPMQHSLSQLQILRKHLPIENGDQKWIRSYLSARYGYLRSEGSCLTGRGSVGYDA